MKLNRTRYYLFTLCVIVFLCIPKIHKANQSVNYITFSPTTNVFRIADSNGAAQLWVSTEDYKGVNDAATNLQKDIERVTAQIPEIITTSASAESTVVIIGTIGQSPVIDELIKQKKLNVDQITGTWESFVIETIKNPYPGIKEALVIAGSDKRGTIFGIYDISEQIGVSPWYWWADVPVEKHTELYVKNGRYVTESPKVKYRGIFINDEAPALSGWVGEHYGSFNNEFYA